MLISLSFILPCYKVEPFVEACIESIEQQDLPKDDFEIICVDDCSPDRTGDVIQSLQQKYSNLRYIRHETNQTAGGARNTGIFHAKGQYIWFVDPDDAIHPQSLSTLYDNVVSDRLDVLLFNYTDTDYGLHPLREDTLLVDSGVLTGQQFIETYFSHQLSRLGIVWRGLYRRQYLLDNQLTYPQIRKSQDVVFAFKSLIKAERVASISESCYMFRNNPASVTHACKTAKVLFSERFQFCGEMHKILIDPSFRLQPCVEKQLSDMCKWSCNPDWREIALLTPDEREQYRAYVGAERKQLQKLVPYMNRKTKWMLLMAMFQRTWNLALNW